MRIAQVAPLYESVPPRLYGGTERVVSWLTEELVARGHEVTLFASGDSETRARLIATSPRGLRLDEEARDPVMAHVTQLGAVVDRLAEFDVVHAHIDVQGFVLGRLAPVPFVHTLHGRLDLPGQREAFAAFPDAALVSISNHQRIPLSGLGLNWRATVYHGMPMEPVPETSGSGRGGYLAFLGRISPEKGPGLAIEVAHEVGIPLRIAAKVDPADREYYEREVRPLIDGTFIQFIGEVDDEEKWKFLGEARCLLFPIDWPEPFGITVIEALASGTPVVARPCGAVPEILEDGETGWFGATVRELADAVRRVDRIDRTRCRATVVERFSIAAMTDGYERVYRELV